MSNLCEPKFSKLYYTFLNKRQTLKLCIWSLENCKASLPNSFPFIASIPDVETKGGRFQFDTKLLDLIKGIIRFVVFSLFCLKSQLEDFHQSFFPFRNKRPHNLDENWVLPLLGCKAKLNSSHFYIQLSTNRLRGTCFTYVPGFEKNVFGSFTDALWEIFEHPSINIPEVTKIDQQFPINKWNEKVPTNIKSRSDQSFQLMVLLVQTWTTVW